MITRITIELDEPILEFKERIEIENALLEAITDAKLLDRYRGLKMENIERVVAVGEVR